MRHSAYLHIPFCAHRCAYCDFHAYAGQQDLIPAYVTALCNEIQYAGGGALTGRRVHTIFFGGGTPSLLAARQIAQLLDALRGSARVDDDAEITLEANPGTVSLEEMRAIRRTGVNRISLGVQSANGHELRLLGRAHHFGDVLRAVSAARRSGFGNLNLDLIFALPEQSLGTWKTSVRRVLKLEPEHVSAYALTLEHGTPFGTWVRRGLLPMPDADLAADMYEWLSEELEAADYRQYEISNWARPGFECRHNLQYWRGEPYLGFGAGAHGYAEGFRYANVLALRDYLERMSESVRIPPAQSSGGGFRLGVRRPMSPACVSQHRQSLDDEMAEFMIMRFRLTREGVPLEAFKRRFGRGLWEQYGDALRRLMRQGLIESGEAEQSELRGEAGAEDRSAAEALRLTPRGRLLGNRVFAEFVS